MDTRNETVDALRGFAALAVCFHHFGVSPNFAVELFWPVASFGWLGVQIFFVISGFVVPLAMYKAGYRLQHWPIFMLKRLIRLEPPYLASIAFFFALGVASWLAPGFRGPAPVWDSAQVAAHIGYVAPLFGFDWLNYAYWTLAIEFQFYLIISILLPSLLGMSNTQRMVALAFVCAVPLIYRQAPEATIVPHLPVFVAGVVTFLRYVNLLGARVYWIALISVAGLLAVASRLEIALMTLVTAIAIAFVRLPRFRLLAYLGAISYSVYLVHWPIGTRVINLARRLDLGPAGRVIVVLLAVTVTCPRVFVPIIT